MVMEQGWEIEGADMSTAFLQTIPTEEERRALTTGVKELCEAHCIPEQGAMRILKNIYGSSAATPNLWEDVNNSMKKLGAVSISKVTLLFGYGS